MTITSRESKQFTLNMNALRQKSQNSRKLMVLNKKTLKESINHIKKLVVGMIAREICLLNIVNGEGFIALVAYKTRITSLFWLVFYKFDREKLCPLQGRIYLLS